MTIELQQKIVEITEEKVHLLLRLENALERIIALREALKAIPASEPMSAMIAKNALWADSRGKT